MPEGSPVEVRVHTIDVYVVRPLPGDWRVLVLRRAPTTRCPTSWEAVHGRIEAGERPEEAAVRELREETGLAVSRLYNITVQPFYMQSAGVVTNAVVFAAFVEEPAPVLVGDEHDAFEWLGVEEALARFAFPGERVSLREIVELLSSGDAGRVDDVMRVL